MGWNGKVIIEVMKANSNDNDNVLNDQCNNGVIIILIMIMI